MDRIVESASVAVDDTLTNSAVNAVRLTVLICTHNRAALLERVLASLDAAVRPARCLVDILVVANACTDGTVAVLEARARGDPGIDHLPLRWVKEPTPGKSLALNRAIPLIDGDLVAFVDDDHRVDSHYLAGILRAADIYPDATLFCGRILPDWDGSEPAWVHDTGPYHIYPLPVPRSEYGDQPRQLTLENVLPGGGNLFLRRPVLDRVGQFSVQLGPHGHDLGGGEDRDFVVRCLTKGETLRYVPWVTQYHFVDRDRLRLDYLLRKGYQRSRYATRSQAGTTRSPPRYMWRKLGTYIVLCTFSFSWPRTRFYLVRFAATLGELRGFIDTGRDRRATRPAGQPSSPAFWMLVPMFLAAVVLIDGSRNTRGALGTSLLVALLSTVGLMIKSIYDFSQTGPPLRREILRSYRGYSYVAVLRLALWAFVLCAAMSWSGIAVYEALSVVTGTTVRYIPTIVSAVLGVVILTLLQFCRHLLYLPGSIAASAQYRMSRLYPLWRRLTAARLGAAQWLGGSFVGVLFAASAWTLISRGEVSPAIGFALLAVMAPLAALLRSIEPNPPAAVSRTTDRPNILMIGSDTLRADRVGASREGLPLTPFIDSLAIRGTHFTACYVPCARTAPSLLSLLTGTWPQHHGVRDNFVSDADTCLPVTGLASLLGDHGYRTAAISDWSGGDLGKFPLGFEILDLPKDQWNIKYLIRQGPKDLRLFLSLFTHNRFGKWFLPELYYLAGVPLTGLLGRDARTLLTSFAERKEPFFLNVFGSTTHPPFASEFPYYSLWSDRNYIGESKFAMARLTDPWEIIRRQSDNKADFDLEQILTLYDGCVRNFDDEVRRIVEHLATCNLSDNTIIVIYSDHGMEFFEHETWGQGNSVRGDSSAKVPLIIVDPRSKGTGTCRHVVRSVDVVPTLLELAQIAVPNDLDGVSLVPYLRDDKADLGLPAFNETGIWLTELPGTPADHLRYPGLLELLEVQDPSTGTLGIKREFRQVIVDAKDRMIRVGSWKLTCQPTTGGARYALFDVANDPNCRFDVAEAYPDIVRDLQQRLSAWTEGTKPY